MNTQETNQPQAIPAQAAPPAPPVGQAPRAAVPIHRSPGLAVVLSCFPGLGHLYLGLYQRAFTIFLTFVLCIWLSEHAGTLGILVAGVVLFGFVDAYRQAQALNLGLAPEPFIGEAPKRPATRSGRLGFGVFILVVGMILLYNQFYPLDFSFLEDWWPLLFVFVGVYMVLGHFRDRQRLAKRESDLELPPVDPSRPA
ncbi:MAG: DUF5668 domain-containing protein [Acidobacteriia bacterium]|nr:DUF5668 domain-containing protein [Terriglobia bacterium]